MPIDFSDDTGKQSGSAADYILNLVSFVEKQFKGRIFLTPTFPYFHKTGNIDLNDIVLNFRVPERKVLTIYDAIDLKTEECSKDSELEKYGVEKNNYYYTVSSLLPNKNLKTIISAIEKLKKGNSEFFFPLVISGVGGGAKDELIELAESNNVVNDIILTPFVDNAERNMLYKNCRVFLFPSIFEGFGMPPIEAMAMGTPVLTTRCTSLEEVTGGLLNYIDDPLDSEKWSNSLKGILSVPDEIQKDALLNKYSRTTIAKEYLSMFRELNE